MAYPTPFGAPPGAPPGYGAVPPQPFPPGYGPPPGYGSYGGHGGPYDPSQARENLLALERQMQAPHAATPPPPPEPLERRVLPEGLTDIVAPEFAVAFSSGVRTLAELQLPPAASPPIPGTVQAPLLSFAFCEQLVASVQGRENGTDGVDVTQELHDELEGVVSVVSEMLARPKGQELEFSNAMIVTYAPGDAGHRPHTDDSDVTINVALNQGYEGGGLMFGPVGGRRMPPGTPPFMHSAQHRMGAAIFHDGGRLHASQPVFAKPRYNLVVWARLRRAGSTAFPRFGRLQRHVQLLVLSFCSPCVLGAAACASRALAELASCDAAWTAAFAHTFDCLEFRQQMVPGQRHSRLWMSGPDVKDHFQLAMQQHQVAQQQPRYMMKCAAPMPGVPGMPGGGFGTTYTLPRVNDDRSSGLFGMSPSMPHGFPYPFAPSAMPFAPPGAYPPAAFPGAGAGAQLPPGCVAVCPPVGGGMLFGMNNSNLTLTFGGVPPIPASSLAGLELLQAAVARSRGTAWRLVAWRPEAEVVKYWVWRYGKWQGVYADVLEWVYDQLSNPELVLEREPKVQPPQWAQEGNAYWEDGDEAV